MDGTWVLFCSTAVDNGIVVVCGRMRCGTEMGESENEGLVSCVTMNPIFGTYLPLHSL